jgi:hypothetical protein
VEFCLHALVKHQIEDQKAQRCCRRILASQNQIKR